MFKLNQKDANTIQIDMSSETINIGKLTEVVEEFFQDFLPSPQSYNTAVAVDEAVTNIIMHGYDNNPNRTIHIVLSKDSKEATVQIESFSKPFIPPIIVEKKKFTFDKLEKGGLGLYLMQEFMDELRFLYDENEKKNTMVMKKYKPLQTA